MAEKGFGVKDINLIGPSGTPTITSPNNLNLNANNVAISTNVSIGGTLTVTGNVSVGGTLTYEDVTSIDSVGIVTARTGVVTPNIDVDDFVTVGSNIQLGNAGVVTATSFSGSGANLTGIAVTEAPVADFTITANGSSAYRFHGGGVDETADDPDLYLIRGQKYRFNNTTGSSHPFRFRVSSGGSTYSTGVSGSENGVQFFTVPLNAPDQLVYQCTIHSGMVGNIYIEKLSSPYVLERWTLTQQKTLSAGSAYNLDSDFTQYGLYFGSSGMSKSSGTFTFPSTGIWKITFASQIFINDTGQSRYHPAEIKSTTNNSSYATLSSSNQSVSSDSSATYSTSITQSYFDVTNTSTHKVQFWTQCEVTAILNGTSQRTYVDFERLGDT